MKVVRMLYKKDVDYNVMRKIYQGVYVAIVSYAARGWAEGLTEQHKRKLVREQRKIINAMTKLCSLDGVQFG